MINPKKKGLKRLLKVARHLAKWHLFNIDRGTNYIEQATEADTNVKHIAAVISEFPKIFKNWHFKDNRTPYLEKHEKLSSLAASALYFGLTGDELFALFVPGYQDPTYRGKELDDYYMMRDVVHNIYQFILYKENKPESKLEELEAFKSLKTKFYYEYPEISTKVYPLSA